MPLPSPLARTPTADPVRVSGFPQGAEAPTIGACFGEFLRRAVPNHNAYGHARALCADVVAALRAELRPKAAADETDFLVGGSVGKRTALAPIRAADLLYLLPARLTAQRAGDALKIVWAVLKNRFEGVTIAETCVLVPRGEAWVKVLPARDHGGAFLTPGIPTLTRATGWRVTNPVAEAATLRLSDSLYGGRPRLLLTALKAWAATCEAPIASFALELLVQDFYTGAPRPFELDRAIVDFWAWAKLRTPCELKPPGGQTPLNIGREWHGKAKAAYWRVTLADHHIKTGKVIDAAVEWRQLLGPLFPVPGAQPLKSLPLFKREGAAL
jgi:hypothetical protein